MTNISIIHDLFKVQRNDSLENIIQIIKSERFKKTVITIRLLITQGNIDEASRLKKTLLGFTPSGIFVEKRSKENLKEYSQLIMLDFDNIAPDKLTILKQRISDDEFTLAYFISPSGNGLKVLIRTDTLPENHEIAFNLVADYYEQKFDNNSDRRVKDIPRLCFFSYDEDVYYNPDSKVFNINPNSENAKQSAGGKNNDYEAVYQRMIDYTNYIQQYYVGNRNNFLHLLSCNCNRAGIPLTNTLANIQRDYPGLPNKEIESTVTSAYKHQEEHGIGYDRFLKPSNRQTDKSLLLPGWIYDCLPEPLLSSCKLFDKREQKDVYLLSALASLSACFPNVFRIYDGEKHHANLYVMVLAQSAKGKRVANWGRRLVADVNSYIEMQEDDGTLEITPVDNDKNKKFNKGLFIPGNTSDAALLEVLTVRSSGLMFETEAMTLGKMLKKEWGDFKDIILKGFHHEPVSSLRKGNKEEIHIDRTIISIFLSGTPDQLSGIISNLEDGLFSRFALYNFNTEFVYDSPYDTVKGERESLFKQYADDILKIKLKMDSFESVNFDIPDWEVMNIERFMDKLIRYSIEKNGDVGESIAKRLDLICLRIAMILSILRNYDKVANNQIAPHALDLEMAYEIGTILLEHSFSLLNDVSLSPKSKIDKRHLLLLNILPLRFSKLEALGIAERFLSMESRMLERDLDDLLEKGKLVKEKHGFYNKVI